MSIKTSYEIDRATAIGVIQSSLHLCTNEQLAEALEAVDESEFRNFMVYDHLPDTSDHTRIISDVRQFFNRLL
jgi:hypothetical protein